MSNEGYDFAYLKETVGLTLSQAMANVALQQPEDPVDFVGNYLLNHVKNVRRSAGSLKQYHSDKKGYELQNQQEMDAQVVKLSAEKAEQDRLQGIEDGYLEEMNNCKSLKEAYDVVLKILCEKTNATGATLGVKVKDKDEVEKVHWIAAYPEGKNCAYDEMVTEESGISFNAFELVQDDTVDEEGNLPPERMKTYTHIENVIREPKMIFYGIPKLGAYLYRGIMVKSYLHDDIKIDTEEGEERNPMDQYLVLALDTLGQARSFTTREIDYFVQWTDTFTKTIENLELSILMREIPLKRTEALQRVDTLEKLNAQISTFDEALVTELEETPENELNVLKTGKVNAHRVQLLSENIDFIDTISKFDIPYKPPALYTIASTLTLLGYTTSDLLSTSTHLPCWTKMKSYLSKSIFLSKLNTAPNASVSTLAQAYLSNTSLDSAGEQSCAIYLLYQFAESSIQSSLAIQEANESENHNGIE